MLSTFIFEPIRWIDRFGWRATCRNEKLAYYCFWREVGKRMGIVAIPPSYEAFEGWSRAYEAAQFRFSETNRRVGTATRDLFASWFPRLVSPFVRYGIYAMLDDAMIESFGFPRPLPFTRVLLSAGLKLRGRLVRLSPPRRAPQFFTDDRNRTHPEGYRIKELGPPKLVANEGRRRERASTNPVD